MARTGFAISPKQFAALTEDPSGLYELVSATLFAEDLGDDDIDTYGEDVVVAARKLLEAGFNEWLGSLPQADQYAWYCEAV
jgi:hypothetical protein